MILLDTHVWIWWVNQTGALTEAQRAAIDTEQDAGTILVSAVSCWEVAVLIERARLTLTMDVGDWVRRALAYPGIRPLNLTPEVAVASTRLPGTFHRDPADRFLVATTLEHACPLVTSDARILAYPHITTIH